MLDDVNQTHLVLASGKAVLHKNIDSDGSSEGPRLPML